MNEANEATGRLDILLRRTAQLAGPRYLGREWPRLAPVVDTALRQYGPSLGSLGEHLITFWPWQTAFWNVLFGRTEGFSTYDRATVKPPLPGPAPAPPAGAYTSTPELHDLQAEALQADAKRWSDWAREAIPALPSGPAPPSTADDLLWLAAALGALGLFLVLRRK